MTKKVAALEAARPHEPLNFAKLKEVIGVIDESIKRQKMNSEEVLMGIRVQNVGAIGPSPVTDVLSISLGFDWDKGRCIIYPMKTLREVDLDELASIRDKYNSDGMKQFEYGQLKKKYDKLVDMYEDLKFLARTHGVKFED